MIWHFKIRNNRFTKLLDFYVLAVIADKADEEKEDLKTIGEKPEEDTEGVFSVKLKNLTGKVITGVTVKNEKDEEKRKEYTEVLERRISG